MVNPAAETPFKLLQLPNELRNSIYSYLDNADVKSLRATCLAMSQDVPLRITRVFLSANSSNINVLMAIGNHETLRHGVTELVWDDARLSTGPELEVERKGYESEGWHQDDPVTNNGCPRWFERDCEEDYCYYRGRKMVPPGGIIPLRESWAYYERLLDSQESNIDNNIDIEAFMVGLKCFPSLKRVTITPSTHGTDFNPLYETPMIRDFPVGFKFPRPKAWPAGSISGPAYVLPWIEQDGVPNRCEEIYGYGVAEYRKRWRGYRAATRFLALDQDHHVTELVVGGNEVRTGINCHIFDQPSAAYNDLVNLLQRPGFSYLSLDLLTGSLYTETWSYYKSGLLHDALAKAKDLKHICLRTTTDPYSDAPYHYVVEDLQKVDFPLSTIFPIDQWPQLEHFGVSGFIVDLDDLISLLVSLPPSLRSVELSHLSFTRKGDSYENLLVQMRDSLDWRSRPEQQRPKVHVIATAYDLDDGYVEVDDAVYSFLYQGGESPFEGNGSLIHEGRGGIRRDIFDPEFMAPY
ncbi:hypothetical protein LB507_007487 [Fusarium sp. FIESC RH6]|nr:hypothetical protein LB507_007487 [Fusarium sp. FIESC RH6]